ncbi:MULTISPECIES: hypothetical protein [Vibrio]|uniref:MalK-like OB fold domain-containing protein n=1 Tax=Vibrio genomosp. F6 str. FF-238 TaxID=1191298 RepID=A0A1E5CM68_9VIBR|nr:MULTISPECIES: hypothetical protein [Vibrio]NOH82507.1 hypothetical protein [Vibrio sp. 03-59-1]OEE70678.1 hypothetical protein A130_08760 [Vibrio genomosp. F6 str. FF-238]
MDEPINIIEATIRACNSKIYVELGNQSWLHIPEHQQDKLKMYIDQPVEFGIRPDFITLAKHNEQLNTIQGKITELHCKDNVQHISFELANSLITSKVRGRMVTSKNIGEYFRFNFDTYFSHIFDLETHSNITI